jgi:hypothetical protein
MFVFDTETRVDATQALNFGSYRIFWDGICLEEGLFYGDDLPEKDRRTLEQYVATHQADTSEKCASNLKLLTRREFVDLLFLFAYKRRYLLVAFNFPFDISRVAVDFTNARGRFAGGFALELWSYVDLSGCDRPDGYRPRIAIKHIDSKRALKAFTARRNPDAVDRIPEGSETGEPEDNYNFRGNFLDLRTLAFALTDRGHTLESACQAFGVEHGKKSVEVHGIVTEAYIDYNRRDVLATSELAIKLLEEYAKHPIALQPTKAYSPASIGKAYLQAMGITPILERQPDFPMEYLGYAASAFFGGRTSVHIRKVPVPVVYTDFLSMYPTVNGLMGLWRFVIAREIRVVEHCASDVIKFLTELDPANLFNPATWRNLCGFVLVVPNGDVLPSRAKYSSESNDWQVAVNHIHTEGNPQNAVWYSIPDVVASVILTGNIPKIVDAFCIEPLGALDGLKPIKLRGTIDVDPGNEDFFKVVIEERKRVSSRDELSEEEKDRLNKALKVLANATSYGIYAEMNRQESDEPVNVVCHGIDKDAFACRVAHPDEPGKYCFPPLAALITGAARLMLALLENSVVELGGTYAMEDTDSMAVVATEHGGEIPCPGGPYRMADGSEAVRALSREQVAGIAERFKALNPYDASAVPGSVLKIEEDNFDSKTRAQRQLYCYAVSAKRYALFLKDENGHPVLLRKGANNHDDRWSQHGLGHLLNPTDPESEDRAWIAQVWLNMVRRAYGLPTEQTRFGNQPAVGRVTVSSPAVMQPLANLNHGKKYADQVKPFNFLVTCQVKAFGHPTETDPEHFHLIAPYSADSRKWLKTPWIDQYTGKQYAITTDGHHGARSTARVKTYDEIVREYEFHPESKCANAFGITCTKQTIGLLQRRHVYIENIRYIGKESNSLEEVEAGLIHAEENVYTEYPDPRRDEWQTKILPELKRLPVAKLIEKTGMSKRAVLDWREERSRPHPENQRRVAEIVKELTDSRFR